MAEGIKARIRSRKFDSRAADARGQCSAFSTSKGLYVLFAFLPPTTCTRCVQRPRDAITLGCLNAELIQGASKQWQRDLIDKLTYGSVPVFRPELWTCNQEVPSAKVQESANMPG